MSDMIERALGYPYAQITQAGQFLPRDGSWQARPVQPSSFLTAHQSGYHLMLAAGSNASPQQLRRKFAEHKHHQPIDMMLIDVADLVAVHSAHLAAYGSVPGTFMQVAGASSRLIALALDDEHLQRINETESLGVNYHLSRLRVKTRQLGEIDMLIYRSIRGVFAPEGRAMAIEAFSSHGHDLRVVSQTQALDAARMATGHEGERDAFVAGIVGDKAHRMVTIALMADHAVADGLEARQV